MPSNFPSLTLNHQTLATLTQTYGLKLPDSGLVLVGLRGLEPDSQGEGMLPRWDLIAKGVDYQSMHCTLAIWDRTHRQCFAALASTVPHRDQVQKAADRKGNLQGKGTNQLEPGYYADLTKGEHLQGKEKGHAALRQTAYRFYRRSKHSAPYRLSDTLFYGNPYDNLHCSWNLDGQSPGFSSAGCLVVAGLPYCPRMSDSGPNQGAWKTFHELLYQAPQKQFPLFLVSGKEAIRIQNESQPKPRLIFGSRGDAVMALQKKLIAAGKLPGKPTGYLGTQTYRAWNSIGLGGYGDVLG